MNLNPREISWTPPTKYEDGSDFGAADFAGYEFGYKDNGAAGDYNLTVAVPVTFDITSLELTELDLPKNKPLDLAMRTVATNGLSSEWTNPLVVKFDTRRPLAPGAVAVGA